MWLALPAGKSLRRLDLEFYSTLLEVLILAFIYESRMYCNIHLHILSPYFFYFTGSMQIPQIQLHIHVHLNLPYKGIRFFIISQNMKCPLQYSPVSTKLLIVHNLLNYMKNKKWKKLTGNSVVDIHFNSYSRSFKSPERFCLLSRLYFSHVFS